MRRKVVTLDVREDLRRGREPFSRIMQTVSALKDGEDLLLQTPFEPKPLYSVLKLRGYTHATKELANGEYEVLFSRSDRGAAPAAGNPLPEPQIQPITMAARRWSSTKDLDARGLEPPEPMVKILEAVASLPADGQLRAHTDRRPMYLYAQLEARGFTGESQQQADGSFITYVSHR